MAKTPTKTDSTNQFKPIEMQTLSKDQPGITKTMYTHVLKFNGLLGDWMKMKEKGVRLFKAVSALKLHECMDDYYPRELKSLMEGLLEILESLKNIIDASAIINQQMQALAKLQPSNEPLIATWSVNQISQSVTEIFESLQKEYKLKEIIIENVAHCRDEKLLEVYISSWELEVYFKMETCALLFAEVGLNMNP